MTSGRPLVFVLGSDWDGGRSAALLTGEERAIGGVTLKHEGNNVLEIPSEVPALKGAPVRVYIYLLFLFWDVQMTYCYLYVSSVV